MNRMSLSIAIAVAVILTSSCKATTEKATNTTKPTTNRQREQESKVLRLLGRATRAQMSSFDCKNSEAGVAVSFNSDTILKDSLVGKDIADNLYETAKKVDPSKECSRLVVVIETERSPTLAEIRNAFGEPDSNSPATFESINPKTGEKTTFPLYSYGWLAFRIEKDKGHSWLLILQRAEPS